jgi:hypothetical protein
MGTSEPPMATTPSQPRERQPREKSPPPLWLTAGAPVAISLVSLLLSVYTIIEANREPEIWLSPPGVVRIALGPQEQALIYAQPRFVSAAHNDRVAVIAGMEMLVTKPDGELATFTWTEQGIWEYDPVSRGLTWFFQADAAPLVVGPSSPQLPICLFESPTGWRWQDGAYRLTIAATRGQGSHSLETTFGMMVSAETAEYLNANPRALWELNTQTDSPPS